MKRPVPVPVKRHRGSRDTHDRYSILTGTVGDAYKYRG
jgi:hypothetical protein